ncbi:MAG: thioredoxin family protein [Saprospiraceae bacterium]
MKQLIIALLLLSPFLFTQCGGSKKTTTSSSSKPKQGVKFVESETLTDLLTIAEKEGKLVFIDFYATWCAPCKMMDKDVFPDKNIANFFNKNFISYKVDGEKGNGQNLAALFDVKAYPTLVWVDKKGRVMARTEGGTYHTELMELAKSALANAGM